MENQTQLKALILNQIIDLLDDKIEILKNDIESIMESRNNETKSSAGDKYETGREMMQMEIEKFDIQLARTLVLKKELSHINIEKQYKKVEFGSLVFTNQGNYFISVALSKIELNNEIFHPISSGSPIGQALQDKKVNDTLQFQGNEITIVDIL